ncbi:MAG: acyl-CoA dehydrogenase family protein, partial [Marinosulfonomonas sp.]|nr:acyl-CoA dehydrogenase family protein [Marinosulfonomonas sp.]
MDFSIPSELEDLRQQIARFVDTEILPVEADRSAYDEHGNINDDVLAILRKKAQAQGLWCLQLKPETGGGGLNKM